MKREHDLSSNVFLPRRPVQSRYVRKQLERLATAYRGGLIPTCIEWTDEATIFEPGRAHVGESLAHHSFTKDPMGQELAGRQFYECDLQGSRFDGLNLTGANFTKCNLHSACFNKGTLKNIRVTRAIANWSEWKSAKAVGATLAESRLLGADLRLADFSECDLSHARLHGVDARNADFSGANLTDCDFSGSDLRGARFSGAVVSATNFSFCNVSRCQFAPIKFGEGNYYRVTIARGQEPVEWPATRPETPPDEGDSRFKAYLQRIKHLRYIKVLRRLSLWLGPKIHGPYAPERFELRMYDAG